MPFGHYFATFFSANLLIDIAALLQVAGFLVRDQLILRLLVLAGTILYGCYYYFAPETPLWQALGWAIVLGGANLSVIVRILIERTTFDMSAREKRLYEAFESLSPGEFRRLLRICTWMEVRETTVLTRIDARNDRLFYILDGTAEVEKGDTRLTVGPDCFIGEISFLLKTPATATVRVGPGALVASWSHADIEAVERRYPAIRVGVREVVNVDLAAKVGQTHR